MKKCFLHIGTEKTGTTAIQSFFTANSKAIKERTGLYYPTLNSLCNGLINHNSLPVYAEDDNKFDDLRAYCNIHDFAALTRFRESLVQKLARELDDQALGEKAHTAILSSEHCHSRLTSEAEVVRLADLLHNYFDEISVIVYLRIQDELALSAYSTAVKSGSTHRFSLPKAATDYYDFDRLLRRWADVFGQSSLNVRVFRKDLLLGGNVVDDFAAQAGLTDLQGYKVAGHQNKSLSVAALEYLRLYNKNQPPLGHVIEKPVLLGLLNEYYSGKGPIPSRDEVIAFASDYVEGNRFVEKTYLQGYPEGVLEFDFDKYPVKVADDNVSEQELLEMGHFLWQQANQKRPNHNSFKPQTQANEAMNIEMEGVLDVLTSSKAQGWVKVKGWNIDREIKPEIIITAGKQIIAKGLANQDRPDVEKTGGAGFGFTLKPLVEMSAIKRPGKLNVEADYQGVKINLPVHKTIQLALKFFQLNANQQRRFVNQIAGSEHISPFNLHPLNPIGRQPCPPKKLCVISYANDAAAWFPYFFQYYSTLVGADGIYVVTPKPESFSAYALGGVITCSNMLYDDIARSKLISGLATGLQAYYEWTLVCDVDEIIVPNPARNVDFFQLLEQQAENVVVSRGIDVFQMEDEAEFRFDLPVLAQRRFGVPNIALYKPHLARVPIRYSDGYHYCNYKLSHPPSGDGFMTLHLKWACKEVRNQVGLMVEEVAYTNKNTANYSKDSLSIEKFNLRLEAYLKKPVQTLDSPVMQAFEDKYVSNLKFSEAKQLWVGENISAPFFVRLT